MADRPTDAMDRLHGEADLSRLAAVSWNLFRYVGDYLHLFGVLVLLAMILMSKSVAGLSRGTQFLYFLVFVTRYLDLFDHIQTTYLVFFKVTYISSSFLILALFAHFDRTYERRYDTCNISLFITGSMIAAILLTSEYSILEILWTFSEFVEAFAMVPQYIFCYRQQGPGRIGAGLYVIALGAYRVFYALNWIYKKVQLPAYSDLRSWVGGFLEILFFVDFLAYRFSGNSLLRTVVLHLDTKINEISDKVEMKVMGKPPRVRRDADGGEVRRRRKGGDEEEQMADV